MTAISLRLPESLHNLARELAQEEGISMNQLITLALAEKVSALTTEWLRARRGATGLSSKRPWPRWPTLNRRTNATGCSYTWYRSAVLLQRANTTTCQIVPTRNGQPCLVHYSQLCVAMLSSQIGQRRFNNVST